MIGTRSQVGLFFWAACILLVAGTVACSSSASPRLADLQRDALLAELISLGFAEAPQAVPAPNIAAGPSGAPGLRFDLVVANGPTELQITFFAHAGQSDAADAFDAFVLFHASASEATVVALEAGSFSAVGDCDADVSTSDRCAFSEASPSLSAKRSIAYERGRDDGSETAVVTEAIQVERYVLLMRTSGGDVERQRIEAGSAIQRLLGDG